MTVYAVLYVSLQGINAALLFFDILRCSGIVNLRLITAWIGRARWNINRFSFASKSCKHQFYTYPTFLDSSFQGEILRSWILRVVKVLSNAEFCLLFFLQMSS